MRRTKENLFIGGIVTFVVIVCIIVHADPIVVPIVGEVTSTTARTCSSLDGPYCFFVNGKVAPEHVTSSSAASGAAGDGSGHDPFAEDNSLTKAVKALLKKLEARQKKQSSKAVETGAFELVGDFDRRHNSIQLQPRRWITQPGPNWITVGLFGGYNNYPPESWQPKQTAPLLLLTITDPDTGEPLNGCSRMLLYRTGKGIRRNNLFEGTWTGHYSCLGSKTQASLVITSSNSGDQRRGPVRATFRFMAQSFRGRDTTLAGCKCVQSWSYEGSDYVNGECGKVASDEPWCFIEEGTCHSDPAGQNWDYCAETREEAKQRQKQAIMEVVFKLNANGQLVQVDGEDIDEVRQQQER